jgi:L-amino acid N-acyltransferase YncA
VAGEQGPAPPVLVAVERTAGAGGDAADEERVVGWASLNQFNPRPAYDYVADCSVYAAREHRGQGVGLLLLTALEQRARDLGYHKLVLAALGHNDAGRRLYERGGFTEVGVYHEQGRLDEQWVDVLIMEEILR